MGDNVVNKTQMTVSKSISLTTKFKQNCFLFEAELKVLISEPIPVKSVLIPVKKMQLRNRIFKKHFISDSLCSNIKKYLLSYECCKNIFNSTTFYKNFQTELSNFPSFS